jgi:hypothetical protein
VHKSVRSGGNAVSRPVAVNRRRFATLAGAAAFAAPMVARGQERWKPEKPITIYNPFAAGGVTDVHMRLLAEIVGKTAAARPHLWAKSPVHPIVRNDLSRQLLPAP